MYWYVSYRKHYVCTQKRAFESSMYLLPILNLLPAKETEKIRGVFCAAAEKPQSNQTQTGVRHTCILCTYGGGDR